MSPASQVTVPAPLWSLVLAGGEGTRLHSRTRGEDGVPVPKQFFPLLEGSLTPLEDTLVRMAPLVPARRCVVVVAEHHRAHWLPLVTTNLSSHWLVQSEVRGTGPATLLGLLHIARQEPDAIVVMTPADHGICNPEPWCDVLARAASSATSGVTLIGVPGDGLDDGYRWIVPAVSLGADVAQVGTFVEKPDPRAARDLRATGALVSTFVVVGRVSDLIGLFEVAAPALVASTLAHLDHVWSWLPRQIRRLFGQAESVDFSADVLASVAQRLLVVRAAGCGWADLGTPERLDDHVEARRSWLAVAAAV